MVDPSRLRTTLLAFVEASVWWAREGDIRVEAERDGSLLRMRLSRAGSEVDSAGAESLFVPRNPGTGAGSKIGLFVARGVVVAKWAPGPGHHELTAAASAIAGRAR